MTHPEWIEVVDSHTEGEPTRVVIEGWPMPSGATMSEKRADLRERFDHLRRAVVTEPRGHDAIVGALLTPPVSEGAHCGVVFFNDVGTLGMCGHGLIGVTKTLAHLGRLAPGAVTIDTPAGPVVSTLLGDGSVTFANVPSFLYAKDAAVEVPGYGPVVGDIAYGGNWFFLTELPEIVIGLPNLERLMAVTRAIREALWDQGVANEAAPIDHIELFSPSPRADAHSRNFVLCPGAAYDRSPCGTGTSAKLATLVERGVLKPGQVWRQESVTGSLFEGTVEVRGDDLIPHIRGRAYVTGTARLRFEPSDPFRYGIRPA
ncbi:MAG: proline racemase family protein [Fimbriimonadaceae bacterium]|nr:proline racemase family protein [Fimbriimonadaceae bacterium]